MVTILDGLRLGKMAALLVKASGKKKVVLSIVPAIKNSKTVTKGNKDENPCTK